MEDQAPKQASGLRNLWFVVVFVLFFGVGYFLGTNKDKIIELFSIPPQYAPGPAWKELDDFSTDNTFRVHMVVNSGNLYVLAKEWNKDPNYDSNKGGVIQIYKYNTTDNKLDYLKNMPACNNSLNEPVSVGNFSDPVSKEKKIFFGTYPMSGFMSYDFDSNVCYAITSYQWGSSIWRTASRGQEYKGKIYYVSYRMWGKANEELYEQRIYAYDPDTGANENLTYDGKEKYYPHGDGRDSTQGPLGVFKGKIFYSNGEFDIDGTKDVSGDMSYYDVDSGDMNLQPMGLPASGFGYNFGLAYPTDKHIYFAGVKVLKAPSKDEKSRRHAGILAYNGSDFVEVDTFEGSYMLAPRAMVVFKNKLYISWRGLEGQAPIHVYKINDDGTYTKEASIGDKQFYVYDLEVYNNEVYAIAQEYNKLSHGVIWKLNIE